MGKKTKRTFLAKPIEQDTSQANHFCLQISIISLKSACFQGFVKKMYQNDYNVFSFYWFLMPILYHSFQLRISE